MEAFVCLSPNEVHKSLISLGNLREIDTAPRGGVPSYISFLGMSPSGLKTDIDLDCYGLESGMVFKGATRAYESMENGMFLK